MLSALSAAFVLSVSGLASAQVIATGPNGPTNPDAPSLNTPVNQTSVSRLISLNAYDDFCLWGPAEAGDTIGDTEATQVAWCTKPRNNARVIPDGTISAVHMVKTPNYVQIQGLLDGTKLNIQSGDQGGELDPHGATGEGNPVGGNVTSNVSGADVFYEEWMSFMSYDMFCMRICTSENSTYSASLMCQHEIDLLGCNWVMPGDYTDNSFTTCDADAAYPPGIYPIDATSTSTFHQRYTNTAVGNEFTIGVTVTPSAAYSIPASSNCVTHTSPSNGITSLAVATASASSGSASSSAASSAASSGSASASGSMSSGMASASKSGSALASATKAAASGASAAASSATTSGASPLTLSGSLYSVAAVLISMAVGGAAIAL